MIMVLSFESLPLIVGAKGERKRVDDIFDSGGYWEAYSETRESTGC